MTDLERATFKTHFTGGLPGDASGVNRPRLVEDALYSFVQPTAVRSPELLGWSQDLAAQFDLRKPERTGPAAEILAGNRVPEGAKPFAARYGGHQFGRWAGQLGDGRAIGLGELPDKSGRLWEFQLKGSGLTPYSRSADGRAVLRSSLREFVCSEAMHFLGVPTTRALSLVLTGEQVIRDMLYDGNPAPEPGAVVCRVAPTFVRFGNFQILHDEPANLKLLADHVIENHFPELGKPSPEVYTEWFREICRRTAHMVVEWMRVGFVHGVMNTDNMSILGLTIDYGPYGWIDDYDLSWTPNTTDLPGRRYCFGRQSEIAMWNCAQLGNALVPLMGERPEELQTGMDEFVRVHDEEFLVMRGAKLGIGTLNDDAGKLLLTQMEEWMQAEEIDMTLFYRGLGEHWRSGQPFLDNVFYGRPSAAHLAKVEEWLKNYRARAEADGVAGPARAERMEKVNPIYVPRNYLLQEAIDAATVGDASKLQELMSVLRNPYRVQPAREAFAAKRPDWARNKVGCSTLSCSS